MMQIDANDMNISPLLSTYIHIGQSQGLIQRDC